MQKALVIAGILGLIFLGMARAADAPQGQSAPKPPEQSDAAKTSPADQQAPPAVAGESAKTAEEPPPPTDKIRVKTQTFTGLLAGCENDELLFKLGDAPIRIKVENVTSIESDSTDPALWKAIVQASLKTGNGVLAFDAATTARKHSPSDSFISQVLSYPGFSRAASACKAAGEAWDAGAKAKRKADIKRNGIRDSIAKLDVKIGSLQASISNPTYTVPVYTIQTQQCSKCGGTGRITQAPPAGTTVGRSGAGGAQFVGGEVPCDVCNGAKTISKQVVTQEKRTRDTTREKTQLALLQEQKTALPAEADAAKKDLNDAAAKLKPLTDARDKAEAQLKALCKKMWKELCGGN